jgi:hypothetical protein
MINTNHKAIKRSGIYFQVCCKSSLSQITKQSNGTVANLYATRNSQLQLMASMNHDAIQWYASRLRIKILATPSKDRLPAISNVAYRPFVIKIQNKMPSFSSEYYRDVYTGWDVSLAGRLVDNDREFLITQKAELCRPHLYRNQMAKFAQHLHAVNRVGTISWQFVNPGHLRINSSSPIPLPRLTLLASKGIIKLSF